MSPTVADRLARFRATNDPAALWPDVTAAAFERAMEEIARVSGALLGGVPTTTLALPASVPPATLGIAAFSAGLGPLLGYWHERGRLAAPAAVGTLLADHLEHGRRRAVRLAAELGRVLEALQRAGVAVALLKGAHTAYAYFPEPGTRPMADLDLLVAPTDVAATQNVLRALGFEEHCSDSAPHRSEWAPPGAQVVRSLELDHTDNPWSVELHATLDRMYTPGIVARFGEFDLADGEWRRDFGTPARCLPQPLLVAYVACHASNHFPQLPLMRLAELVLVAQRDLTGGDAWDAVEDLLTRSGSERFAYPALALAERLVAGTVPAPLLDRLAARTPRGLRRLIRHTTPATALRFTPVRLGYMPLWAATLRERLAYFAHLAWPHRADGPVGLGDALGWQRGRLTRLMRAVLRRSP